jgi:hypothetical protein
MLKRLKFSKRIWLPALFCLTTSIHFSCQKADPAPYSDPPQYEPATIGKTVFSAEANQSSMMAFAPTITISGGYTSLIGTTANYTITLTFPSAIGPGNYTNHFAGVSMSIFDGINTYLCNSNNGTGSIEIDSITNGRYSGSFNFIGQDQPNPSEGALGNFSNL